MSEIKHPAFIPMAIPNAIFISQNTVIADENVFQYQFVNLSNVPVTINGMWLDRYFSGNHEAPTVISGAFNIWEPPMQAGEEDTSSYQIAFQDTYYASVVAPIHRLFVAKKQYAPRPFNRKPRNG